jgi:O-antigen/teichoic acid export membrane protein
MILRILGSNKGLLYVAIGNLLGAILTGSFWLLLATILNVSDYGNINYLIAVGSISSFISLFGLNTTVTTFLAKGYSRINVQANQLITITGILAAALLTIVMGWEIGLLVLGMMFWIMSQYELLGKKQYTKYAILCLVLYYLFGVTGIVIGFAVSFLLFSYVYFRSVRNFTLKFNVLRSTGKFSLHAYSFNMTTAFLMYFDKLVIMPLFGSAVLGYYQISLQFLLLLGMIPISLYQYLLTEESSGSKTGKIRILGFSSSFGLALLLFALGPWVISTFFPNFVNSIEAVRITSIGIIPMTATWVINSRFFSMNETRYVAIGSVIFLTSQFVLILLLGNFMGVSGLAIALDVALTLQSIYLYFSKIRLDRMRSSLTVVE